MNIPTLTLDEMVDALSVLAKNFLIGKAGAQVPPIIHVQFKDRPPSVMVAPWTNDDQKHAFIEAMRMSMKIFRNQIVNYAFMSEAWQATEDRDHPLGLQPRDREDRIEIVMINAFDGTDQRFRILEISRDAKGLVDKLTAKDDGITAIGGELHNLLDD